MRDRVIIPTFDRPEMLALCLERIKQAEGTRDLDIYVYVDGHKDQRQVGLVETLEIAEWYAPWVLTRTRQKHDFHGNSFSVLLALHEAFVSRCKHVFLIEDDVLVEPDFFAWQYRQLKEHPDVFAVIGGKNTRNTIWKFDGVESYFTTGEELCSIGVGYPRSTLFKIMPHICYPYFSDMVGYCKQTFPEHTGNPNMAEQDGLIQRIMLREEHKVIWSNPVRAHHVGWYGYHRPHTERPTGTLEERIAKVREIIADPERLKRIAQRDDVEISAFR